MQERKAAAGSLAVPPAWLAPPLALALHRLRGAAAGYSQLMAGSLMRLALQAAYFFALVNALSLEDMGAFAAISATGLMIGAFTGFGFAGFAFRAAAGRPRLLGRYLGTFYGSLALSLPLSLAVAAPVYLILFAHTLPFWAFAAIVAVETVIWRQVQLVQQINNGLGRYGQGSLAIALGSALRAAGAVGFLLLAAGGLACWALVYFAVNAAAAALVTLAFHPPVGLVFSARLFKKRLRDGLLFCLSYFAFSVQNQLDKLIVLSLADARLAGIYAISTRILDFTATPFRSFYVMFTRKLLGEGKPRDLVRRGLVAEGGIALLSTLGFLVLVGVLLARPGLLGGNVESALPFFAMMLAVPALKNLLEFHGELFYVSQRMTIRAVLAVALVAINIGALALLARSGIGLARFGLWLNALYAVLYGLSVVAVYRTMRSWGGAR